jgi:hypothetical protein
MSKHLHMSFSAVAHLAEVLYLQALLRTETENSLICLVGTRIPSVYKGMAIYFALKNINKK